MQLDPNRKFKLVKLNGQTFYRQDGKLFSDQPRQKATQEKNEYLARLRGRHGL